MIGNLFYGTEGWAAMSDQGFQAFKGEATNSSWKISPNERRQRRHRPAHAEFPGGVQIAQLQRPAR